MVVKAWWPVRYRWGVVALGVIARGVFSRKIEAENRNKIECY